jgi:hypothetical protein
MPIQEGGNFQPTNNIVSPGVFTRETDLSGVAQGVADIGGVIVAPFPKGPGFAPTLVQDVATLEEKFGVADGTYYGPYSAKEYLNERGFVTVCRVGALTGYHQQYPIVVHAIKGTYNRNLGQGALNSDSSTIILNNTYPALLYRTGSGFFSASVIMAGDTTVTFQSTAANTSGTSFNDATSSNGSTTLAGQTVNLGNVVFNGGATGPGVYMSPEFSSSWSSSLGSFSGVGYTSMQGVIDSMSLNTNAAAPYVYFSSSFSQASLITSGGDYSVYVISAIVKYGTVANCGQPIWTLSGVVSGSFGTFTGTFTPTGTTVFDVCSGSWTTTGGADVKVLATLADTQYSPPNSTLHATGFSGSTYAATDAIVGATSVTNNYTINLKKTGDTSTLGNYQFSLDASSTKYITSVFGNDATAGADWDGVSKLEASYLYDVFEDSIAKVVADNATTNPIWFISASVLPNSQMQGEPLNFTDAYSLDLNNGDSGFGLTNAYTPWVISQKIAPWNGGASTRFELFRVATLSDGNNMNTSYKIEISNVKTAGTVSGTDWGTFTLAVRKYSDTDKKPVYLEIFQNLTLDPESSNYIARRIGDRYNYINFNGKIIEYGTYSNNSKHIRIEMNSQTLPVAAIPYGFKAMSTPLAGGIGRWTPCLKYTRASLYGLNPGKYASGIAFNDAPTGADAELATLYPTLDTGIGVADDNKQYFAPLPDFGAWTSIGNNQVFALDDTLTDGGYVSSSMAATGSKLAAAYSGAIPTTNTGTLETTYVKMRKFVFGFQGGFDGQSPAIPINLGSDIIAGNTQGLNCTDINSGGSIAYKQCIGALSNVDEFDINLITTPGITHQHHSYVTNLVVDMCENRGDCFYIMDLHTTPATEGSVTQIDEVVGYAASYDTSYACAYYPWVKILDTNTNKIVTVPPSVLMPAVYAASDKTAAEWFAPAGLNRGGIPKAVQVCDRTTHSDRDDLYEGKVNPIAAFPGQGIVVWGQKTLQTEASALDRINVRRLLINIKKYFASISKYLVFEQNTSSTRNRFLNIVNPYLESVQQRSGLYAFEVVMDDSNNTADIIDRNILYGQIYLQPTKTAEFILLDFNILPTGGAIFPTA